jgi:translocator assembly and maintenance protein 41
MDNVDPAGLLSAFPRAHYAFAYGSGVFPQPGAPSLAPPMLDVVFAVDDAEAWHAENLARNPRHYTWLARAAGAHAIARVQNSAFGARVWYNAMVPLPADALRGAPPPPPPPPGAPPRTMKYGVITTAALQADLLHWTTLYVAGRLHKPVRRLGAALPRAAPLRGALAANLRSALCAALLSLPAHFSAAQLFTAVTALSYTGDWRMALGENPHKVRNIVAGSLPHFHALYAPLLAAPPFSLLLSAEGGGFSMDVTPRARAEVGLRLPLHLQRLMAEARSGGGGGSGGGALAGIAADLPSARTALAEPRVAALWARGGDAAASTLRPALSGIVGAPARGQSLMGIVTAGPAKAAAYAAAKLVKAALGALKG